MQYQGFRMIENQLLGANLRNQIEKPLMKKQTYRSSPTKPRRTREDIQIIREALYSLLANSHPMTVRQIYYQMVTHQVIDKTEAEYKQTVCRLLALMRRQGIIPFGWIADNTRWMRKPRTFTGLQNALQITAQTYRRNLWDSQEAYVEIWLEKDALAGVLYDITSEYDVPLMVSRGYSSLSFLYEAAEAIKTQRKPAYLYYFGDYDPSGVNITQTIERNLRDLAPDAEIYFERVAVTRDQIEEWQLPTRPTKKSDSRSKGFIGESVEVDAIPITFLKGLATECIERHLNVEELVRLREIEEAERETLERVTAFLFNEAA
jgi:hypothetical protein